MHPTQDLSCTLVSVLIPDATRLQGLNPIQLKAMGRLYVKTARQAIAFFQSGHFAKLDALIGNSSCERHMLKLLRLTSSALLREELQTLLPQLSKIEQAMTRLADISQLFQQIASMRISDGMAYLFQARLLTVTKQEVLNLEGYVMGEKTDISRIDQLSSGISETLRREMVQRAQQQMAEQANLALCEGAHHIRGLQEEERSLLLKMLNREAIRTVSEDGYPPKGFMCSYYSIKGALLLLRQNQTLVAIKNLTREGEKPLLLLYRARHPGDPLTPVTPEEKAELCGKNTSSALLEGFVPLGTTAELLAANLNRYIFEEVMLTCAAQDDPYERGSTLDAVPVEALQEILRYREKARAFGCVKNANPFFFLDHLSLSNLDYELKLTGEKRLCKPPA